jgi:hypothetical protein
MTFSKILVRTFREFCERTERTSGTARGLHCGENSRKAGYGGVDSSTGFRWLQNLLRGGTVMKKLLASCALAAMSFAVAPLAAIAAEAQCPLQNATLHGTYVVSGTGTIVGVGPLAAVGEVTFDGRGNSIATYTASVNGTINKGVMVTGTYTVNPDCTASHAESDGSHYDYVVAPDGNTVTWIKTDPGTVVSGTEVRLRH